MLGSIPTPSASEIEQRSACKAHILEVVGSNPTPASNFKIVIMKEKEIGELIKKRRLELGLSQSMVGNNAGVTYQTVINIEKGCKPSLQSVLGILDVLGLKIEISPK